MSEKLPKFFRISPPLVVQNFDKCPVSIKFLHRTFNILLCKYFHGSSYANLMKETILSHSYFIFFQGTISFVLLCLQDLFDVFSFLLGVLDLITKTKSCTI